MYILSKIHLSNNFLLSIHLSEHNEYMIVDSRHYVLLGGRVVALPYLRQSIIYTNPLHNYTPITFCNNLIPYFRRCVKGVKKGAPKRSFGYLLNLIICNCAVFCNCSVGTVNRIITSIYVPFRRLSNRPPCFYSSIEINYI